LSLSKRTRRRIVLLALVAAGLTYGSLATRFERGRIAARAQQVTRAAAPAHRVDRAALMTDLRALADPSLEGRRTGSPGGLRARAYVTEALTAAGVRPFEGHFAHQFAFVHRSLKGLLLPGRPFVTEYKNAANVLGIVPASDEAAPRWIVLSAHYDHLGRRDGVVYPGADDNASGVAVMLAVARLAAREPGRHPLVLAAFDGEEQGLQGSRAFVAGERLTPGRVAVNVNLDMVSRNDRREIFAAGTNPWPQLRPIVDAVQRRTPVKILFGHDRPMYAAGFVDDWTQQSDQGAFADVDIPFLYFGVEDHADYHKPTDTVDKIDPAFLGDVADMIADTVFTLDQQLP
jgi:hypothetical protein